MGRLVWVGGLAFALGGCVRPEAMDAVETTKQYAASMWSVATPVDVPPDVRPGASYSMELVAVSVSQAENGREELVPATDPRGLLLRGYFPGRALDPVLHVGDLHFHRYRYTDEGRLMFVVADVALLKAGAAVYVQYGDNEHSRIDITASLELTP